MLRNCAVGTVAAVLGATLACSDREARTFLATDLPAYTVAPTAAPGTTTAETTTAAPPMAPRWAQIDGVEVLRVNGVASHPATPPNAPPTTIAGAAT